MEEWRSVPGWEGFYEVSDLGRVRSLTRVVVTSTGRMQRVVGRVLTGSRDRRGYTMIMLRRPGSYLMTRVHALVMLAFVGPLPPGLEVLHGRDDKGDNRLVNLRYGTSSENKRDVVARGAHPEQLKDRCPRRHLLLAPNLVPARLPSRICLACGRGRNRVGGTLQERSDRAYVELGFELAVVA